MKKKIFLLLFMVLLSSIVAVVSIGNRLNFNVNEPSNETQNINALLFEKNNYNVEKNVDGFIATDCDGATVRQLYVNDNITSITFDNHKMDNYKLCSYSENELKEQRYSIETRYNYDKNNNISEINNNGKIFSFQYDDNSNLLTGMVDGVIRQRNYYNDENNLCKTTYPNGFSKEYTYKDDKLECVKVNGKPWYEFSSNGNGTSIFNRRINEEIKQTYNNDNKLSEEIYSDEVMIKYRYNGDKIKSVSIENNGYNYTTNYDENMIEFKNSLLVNNEDDYGRKTGYNLNNLKIKYDYQYDDPFDLSPASFVFDKHNICYEYDKKGNMITLIDNNILKCEYEYDSLNQLVVEKNHAKNTTTKYTYDQRGNIITKDINGVKYEYSFNEKDELTAINGSRVDYDLCGNLINYGDKTYSWEGKMLKKINNNSNNVNYEYNADGIRIRKEVNGITTKYYLYNNKVIAESTNDKFIYYLYDNNWEIYGLSIDNSEYFYVKNPFKDIVGIVDSLGNLVVEYEYDSYGNLLECKDLTDNNIGKINKYRYKSYRYDDESGLYYLNSRYYSPTLGRFISEDDLKVLSNNVTASPYINLYSYAQNNPIKYFDPNGDSVLVIGGLALSIKALLFVGIVAVVTIIIATQSDKIARAMNDAFDNFVDLIRTLRDSMPSLWDIIFKSSSTEVHHIVAKAAAAAEPARVRCRNFGINVYNDSHNLVPIKYRLHRKLHTNAYYSAVNSIIVPAHNKDDIYFRMEGIKTTLLVINYLS